MSDDSTVRIDFSPEQYPMRVAFYPADSVADEYPLWETTITGPGLFTMPDMTTFNCLPRIVLTDAFGKDRHIEVPS